LSSFSGGISNAGRIEGSVDVLHTQVFAGGIDNTGTVVGTVDVLGEFLFLPTFLGGIDNKGTIAAITRDAVVVSSIGFFGNTGVGGSIVNSGRISAGEIGIELAAVSLLSGGVSNSGSISAGLAGIAVGAFSPSSAAAPVSTFAGNVANTGTIRAMTGIAVVLDSYVSGAVADNGTIRASAFGILVDSGGEVSGGIVVAEKGTVIVSGGTAVAVENTTAFSGNIVNSGTLSAGNAGIAIVDVPSFDANVTNSGAITARTGISIADSTIGGAIVDTGNIKATGAGILVDSASEIVAPEIAIDITGGSLTGGIVNFGVISGSVGIEVTGAHGVGVFDAGTIIGAGGTAVDLRAASNTFTLESGYSVTGTVIGSGGNTLQLGGTGSDTFDLSSIGSGAQYRGFTTFNVVGGTWTVSSAGSGWNVDGGTLALPSGSFLLSTTVRSGGTLEVLSGAHVSATTVSNSGTVLVSSGGTADPTRLLSGSTEIIASGGVDNDAQVSGGEQDVFGSASGTTVFSGSQVVEAGGIAIGTTVKNAGTVAVQFGAIVTGIISSGGALELVGSGASAPGVTLNSGATLEVASGAIIGKNVSTGFPVKVLAGGIESGGTILSGAIVDVLSGGVASGITVASGGKVIVFSGGAQVDATVDSGGTEIVSGLVDASGTVTLAGVTSVASHAVLEMLSGGTGLLAGKVTNGGTLFASSSGSLIEIASGAVVSGGIALIGDGIVDIAGSSGESVSFLSTGSGGLEIADTLSHTSAYSGKVSGFGGSGHSNHDQFIDLVSVTSAINAISLSYVSAASHTSGTLFVSSGGAVVAEINMIGAYTSANFSALADSNSKVEIVDPTVPNGGSVYGGPGPTFNAHSGIDLSDIAFGAQTTLAYAENRAPPASGVTELRYAAALTLLGNYMAGSFATTAGGNGGALISAAQTQQPLLTHPPHG
jgi:autotransporter passenger strand-loop-strand repeat protein